MTNYNRRLPLSGMLALISLLALSCQSAGAQVVSGSMVGNVTDASGSAIPGASVKITLIQTNDSRSVETNGLGGYTIATLQIGAVTERVEIVATTAVLQTDRADIHAEVTAKDLTELPQPNRTYSG